MRIIADSKIPFLKGVFEPFVDIKYLPGDSISTKDLKEAEVLITRTRTKCNAELLQGTNIRFIATATIGYDHIDTEYCKKNEISWVNAPGCNSYSVQQYFTAALLLWAQKEGVDLRKRTLGVIGVGNVGSKVVEIAENLELQVLLNDPPRMHNEGKCGFVSIEGIKRDADIISLHVPLNTTGPYPTNQMVNLEFINSLKNRTLLINTSRGEIVSGEAVKYGMTNGIIEYFINDVWENEPHADLDLLKKTFIATPHIAGYSQDGKAAGTAAVVKAVGQYLQLPLEDWIMEDLSAPKTSEFKINALNKSFQDICTEAVLKTYPIWKDDEKFRTNPGDFESLRSNYWKRREFSAYKVLLKNDHSNIVNRLRNIGFQADEIEN